MKQVRCAWSTVTKFSVSNDAEGFYVSFKYNEAAGCQVMHEIGGHGQGCQRQHGKSNKKLLNPQRNVAVIAIDFPEPQAPRNPCLSKKGPMLQLIDYEDSIIFPDQLLGARAVSRKLQR